MSHHQHWDSMAIQDGHRALYKEPLTAPDTGSIICPWLASNIDRSSCSTSIDPFRCSQDSQRGVEDKLVFRVYGFRQCLEASFGDHVAPFGAIDLGGRNSGIWIN